jgi:hypothetical protein
VKLKVVGTSLVGVKCFDLSLVMSDCWLLFASLDLGLMVGMGEIHVLSQDDDDACECRHLPEGVIRSPPFCILMSNGGNPIPSFWFR